MTMPKCRNCGKILVEDHRCKTDTVPERRTTPRPLPATAKPHERKTVGERSKALGPKLPKGIKTYKIESDTVVTVYRDHGQSREQRPRFVGYLTKTGVHLQHHQRLSNPMPTTAPRWTQLDLIEKAEDRRQERQHKAHVKIADEYAERARRRKESAKIYGKRNTG